MKGETEGREAFGEGFHGLPSARARAAMSVLQLAEEIAKHKVASPPHIVLSHELNLKLVREQARATIGAGWLAVGGAVSAVVLTFALGWVVGASPKKESNNNPTTQQTGQPAAEPVGNKLPPIPAVAAPPVVVVDPLSVPHAQGASAAGKK